jgi:hypothetical protein
MLARFDIVLVAFPFTNGPNVKPRPAMVIGLSERHQDVLLAFRLLELPAEMSSIYQQSIHNSLRAA